MKRIYILALLLLPLLAISQTIVDTEPQNKNVVLEVFTGINCGFCPQGQTVANTISNNNPGRVVHVNVHAGGFANPGSGQPDFRTPFGASLVNQADVGGYPAGTVNRHFFKNLHMNGGTAMGRSSWTTAANEILEQPSYVNIGAEAEIDLTTREVSVFVEAYYTNSSTQTINKLNVALLQNNTVGFQAGQGDDYVHMRRLVHLLTGQWGVDIENTETGSLYSQTFTYTIPGDFNSIDAVIEDMELAVYIAEGNQEVITGIKVQPVLVNMPDYQLLLTPQFPEELYEGCLSPALNIKSKGGETINSLDISYQINDNQIVNHTWEGELNYGEEVEITLPELAEFILYNNNTITITVENENYPDNSYSISGEFSKAPATIEKDLTVEIKTDGYGDETTWAILDNNNQLIANGGGYGNNQIFTDNVSFEIGYYRLVAHDSYGDGIEGGGYVRLKNEDEIIIDIPGDSFTNHKIKYFKITEPAIISFLPEDGILGNVQEENMIIQSDKSLFDDNWILLDNELAENLISLNVGQADGEQIDFTATVDELARTIEISIIEDLSDEQNIVLTLSNIIHDEDEVALNDISANFTITNTNTSLQNIADFSIFPNPSLGEFQIKLPETAKVKNIDIYSVAGMHLFGKEITSTNPTIRLNIKKPQGVYIIKVTMKNGDILTNRLVIE